MRAALVDLLEQMMRGQPGADRPVYPPADTFVPDLVATMLVEAITWWLEQSRPYPPQEIARRCVQLASAIFKETSTWQ
jgi:hypothetical protein